MTTPTPSPAPPPTPKPTPPVDVQVWEKDLVRWAVPVLVAIFGGWAAKAGFNITNASISTAVGGVIGGVYYGVFSFLENKFPWLGRFLGAVNPTPSAPASAKK